MEQFIASYLFQNKTCPIPGIGSLVLTNTAAVTDFTNKKITAPAPAIRFQQDEPNADPLLSYIAAKTNSSTYEVGAALDHFCDGLKEELTNGSTAKLPGIGNFHVDASGNINFAPEELLPFFLPPVTAERVVHPEAEHHILVGEKETTNTLMTEYFNEEPVKKDRWWIWAIILGAIALVTILFYLNDVNSSSMFGNAIKI